MTWQKHNKSIIEREREREREKDWDVSERDRESYKNNRKRQIKQPNLSKNNWK